MRVGVCVRGWFRTRPIFAIFAVFFVRARLIFVIFAVFFVRARPIEAIRNVQNNRVLGKTKDSIPEEHLIATRRQKPSSIMVWAGIMSDGKKTLLFPLVFIEEGV